jgi:hypothetical protein
LKKKDLRHSLAASHIYSKLSSVLPNRKNKGRSVELLGCVLQIVHQEGMQPCGNGPCPSSSSLTLNDSQNVDEQAMREQEL